MSEIYSDLVNEWNCLVNYKLKLNDIIKPTSQSLTIIFANYLRMLHLDLFPLIKNNDEHISVQSKLILANYINHLYTMSEKSTKFTLFDLISPTTKKTAHVMGILLNYLKYYNMVKTDVELQSNDVIEAYNKILCEKNQLIVKNEKKKLAEKKNDNNIKENEIKLPKVMKEVRELEKQYNSLIDKIKMCENDIEISKEEIGQLLKTEQNLKSNIITDNEVEKLVKTREITANAIKEQEDIEHYVKRCNIEIANTVSKWDEALQYCDQFLKNNENIFDLIKTEKDTRFRANEESKKYTIAEQDVEKLKNKILEMEKNIQTDEMKNKKVIEETKTNEHHLGDLNRKLMLKNSEIDKIEKQNIILNKKIMITNTSIDDIDEEIDFIKKSSKEIFKEILECQPDENHDNSIN